MRIVPVEHSELSFLSGGGEMGERIRAFDWTRTSLGPPLQWPLALRTLVGVMHNSHQAMLIAWGPERTMIYNDGYAAICGRRHPAALGARFDQVWFDLMGQIGPILERAFAGESTHMDDIGFVMHRNGYPEEAHFSFSFTPVRDEGGTVVGMFCPCSEITGQVLAERRLAEQAERQRQLFAKAPGFIFVLRGPEHRFEFVNDTQLRLFGDRGFIGKTMREAFPELSGQGYYELLDRVYANGDRFVARAMPALLRSPVDGRLDELLLDFVYEPIRDDQGAVGGIFCEGFDVTERARATVRLEASEQRQAFLLALGDRLHDAATPEQALDASVRATGEHLGAGRVHYVTFDNTLTRYEIAHEWTDTEQASLVGTGTLDAFGHDFFAALRAGRTVVVDDVRVDPLTREAANGYLAIGTAAVISTPLVRRGRLLATLSVDHGSPRAWREDEATLLREIAERTWSAVERAQAEAALRGSEQRLQALVRHLPGGAVFVLDRGLRYRMAEGGGLREAGYVPEDFIGRTIAEAIGAGLAPVDEEDCRQALAGRPFRREHSARGRHYLSHGVPLRADGGGIEATLVVSYDITERKSVEGTLREADRAKDEFLAMLAHELRNPLAPLTNALRLLERTEPMTERGSSLLRMAERQRAQLARLVDDLLEVTRFTRGSIALRPEPLMVQHVVYSAAESLNAAIEDRGQRIRFEMPQQPLRLTADPVRLTQILENLLTNASKYTDAGGEIVVRLAPRGDEVVIEVSDTGIGIAPEHLPRLFQPFMQIDAAIDRSHGGLGIGLALVRRLVELHGGSVAATSDGIGCGSTFTVRLPLRDGKSEATGSTR